MIKHLVLKLTNSKLNHLYSFLFEVFSSVLCDSKFLFCYSDELYQAIKYKSK